KGSTGTRDVFSYTPVPYNVSFNLYSFTRTTEDNLQIMEQILPYFTPEMNLSIKMLQDPDLTQDVPLLLNSINTDDQ
ncbi:tail sheath stabilizer and completion protein, partial [Helicobacter pylori]|uniref:tail sheath stabilizer and completion protein n=1 Tax=Helicobacter pylori TaxID=210 RepID=UPI002928BE2F|nr:tail sheath stabilizer and completion protein [Helicobacter pylori]